MKFARRIIWPGGNTSKGNVMRNLMMIGTAGLLISLGGTAAFAENPNVPGFSPYAIMAYDASPAPPVTPLVERRSADVGGGYSDSTVPNGNVPSFSPYAIMPQGH
jgi:hypothetical protein